MSSDNRTLTVTIVGNASSAVGAVGKVGKAVDDVGEKAVKSGGKIRQGLSSALGQVAQQGGLLAPVSEIISGMGEAAEVAKNKHAALGDKMMAVGSIATGLGAALAIEGSKDKAAQQQLQQAIDNTGKSYEDYKEEIEKTIQSQAKFGHGAVDTQNALQTLTQATNDPKKALDEMGLAADLAAAKHESLTAASDQLARLLSGKGARTLASFGISLKDASGKTKDMDEVTKELAAKLKGQASASADTFSGKLTALRTELSNNVAAIGEKYGPALTALGGVVTVAGGAMNAAASLAEKFGGKSAKAAQAANALKEAQLGATAATEAETVAQGELDVAMDANPIGLIVLAIAALVTGLVIAYEKSKTFRDIVNGAFSAVSDAAAGMWNDVLKPTFKFIISAFLDVAKTLVHGAASAFGWVPGIGGKLKSAARKFDEFANSVNESLGTIKSRDVHVAVQTVVSSVTVGDSTAANLASTYNSQVPIYQGTISSSDAANGTLGSNYTSQVPGAKQAAAGVAALKQSSAYKKLTSGGSGGGGGGGGGSSAPVGPTKAEMLAKVMAESLVKGLETRYKRVQASTDKLKKLVADKKTALQDALKAEKDYAAGIAQAASAGSLSAIQGADDGNGGKLAVNQGDVAAGLQAKLTNLNAFLATIKQLGTLGLSKSLMAQIFALGPDQGAPYAAAILAGGQDAVNTDNSLQGAIEASASSLGQYAGTNQYGDQVKAARQDYYHFEVKVAGRVTSEKDLAAEIATTVREELAKEAKRNGKKT